MPFYDIGDYEFTVLSIMLLLIPTAFYIMGMFEGRKGRVLFLIGLAFHALSIVHRGIALGGLPLAEKHDNISFMAFGTALVYLYFKHKGLKALSSLAPPLIVVLMFVAIGHRQINTISPFMQTPWFYLHTFFYFLSYGFFGISACMGGYYLLAGQAEYERFQHWGAVHGWILMSLSLFAGSVWFYLAYGTYWLWTSKELWITVTWLYYGLYLHARLIKGLKGRPAALIGALGFAVALFTYFGVGTVIKSPPTQF